MRALVSRLLLGSLIGVAVAMLAPGAAFAIDEFPVPTAASQPSGITLGPDGALWFTEENAPPGAKHKIGRITSSGAISEYLIPTDAATPSKIVTGPDGALWFTEYATHKIGRLDPALAVPGTSNGITEYPPGGLTVPSNPDGIAVGPDGAGGKALWFTQYGGNKISMITTGGTITEYPLPVPNSRPGDIALGPDGRMWYVETESQKIGRIDPAAAVPGTSNGIAEFSLPAGSDPSGIASSTATLWFTQLLGNRIGQLSTSGSLLNEFPAGSGPSGIAFGPDGALWFTESTGNKIGRMTTGGSLTEFTIPTPNTDPSDIVSGPGGLWFTEFNGNNIGLIRASSSSGSFVPAPPPPPSITPSAAKASVLSLSISPSKFRAAAAGASISAKVGAKVTYRLSKAATTKFTAERESVGRKQGKKCVKPTRRNKRGKRCKLYKAVKGSFTDSGKAGSNSFRFTGRIAKKKLKPGKYRLLAQPSGSSSSAAKQARFKIVRR
jgi:streptogramin lyase